MADVDVDRLEALSRALPCADWEGAVPADKLEECRRILREVAGRLLSEHRAVGAPRGERDETAPAGAPDRAAILRAAVHELNALDDGFICTIEREDLCDHLAAIGTAAGISEEEIDAALDEREW